MKMVFAELLLNQASVYSYSSSLCKRSFITYFK